MKTDKEISFELVEWIRENRWVAPAPIPWLDFYDQIVDKLEKKIGFLLDDDEKPHPNVITHGYPPPDSKIIEAQIAWAQRHGLINFADSFLRNIEPNQWTKHVRFR